MQNEEGKADELLGEVTIPSNLQFSARSFADEDYAKEANVQVALRPQRHQSIHRSN